MAPTFYHYLPVPMEKTWGEQGPGISRRCLVAAVLMLLIVVGLVISLIHFAVRANSEACRDGLRVWDECRNTTHLLQRQLTRAQENLRQAETQANRTVVTLQDSLKKKESQVLEQQAQIQEQQAQIQEQQAQIQEQQAHIQELESMIMKLNQELATLRTKEEASSTAQNSASSMVVSSLLMFVVPVFLLF
ncbi:bone marrow stromal antigen 2 isoform X2 [Alexandromys fortis]|uniref:bone marrow stromal antigen 2 isoform X2 n=1 Tax=Alexandromys fortis TaxID=100897 RepID=UPI002153336A|nr:bone marrow stromal antigen 2 isoform X2 [Microtus fortis]